MLKRGELNQADCDDLCRTYLLRILGAISTLCLTSDKDETFEDHVDPSRLTGENLVEQMAAKLLKLSDPALMASPLPQHLKSICEGAIPFESQSTLEQICDPLDEQNSKPDFREFTKCRTDHLRAICRSMAPVALDVGARACFSAVVSGSTTLETARCALVLFATWLPVAPQLNPLVADLFRTIPCPFDSMEDLPDNVKYIIAEATHRIYEHFCKRGDYMTTNQWWSWGSLIALVSRKPVFERAVMSEEGSSDLFPFDYVEGARWHAARAIGYVVGFRPFEFGKFLKNNGVDNTIVPWVLHPWILEDEEEQAQSLYVRGEARVFHEKDTVLLPSSEQIRGFVPLHSTLVDSGRGVLLCKMDPLRGVREGLRQGLGREVRRGQRLILTRTTARNLSLLGAALSVDPVPPILVCGPHGSGKSSLIREMAHLCSPSKELMEMHMDEETDSKTLIGSYTTTDMPGEFEWKPGALTRAVRTGQWVLMEDLDTVPAEIQAALVQLLQNRLLPLARGKVERCHPNFRLFGTCTTVAESGHDMFDTDDSTLRQRRTVASARGGKGIVNPLSWLKVHVDPLGFAELKEISMNLYPDLPLLVIECALNVLTALDKSGRIAGDYTNPKYISIPSTQRSHEDTLDLAKRCRIRRGRPASVRDFLKLLSRVSHVVQFESTAAYVTEFQRMMCLAETVDLFAASCPFRQQRREFVNTVAAPLWGVSGDLALQHFESRCPTTMQGENYFEVGRSRISMSSKPLPSAGSTVSSFALTSFSLRLMESIAVSVSENEPVLLVGETGCGKTSLVQHLARLTEHELIVHNLSLQTDSADLLGGYRPLELRHIARRLYLEFVELFVSTFSRKQNSEFLKYTALVHTKGNWKTLSQCFQRAAQLGLKKAVERVHKGIMAGSSVTDINDWNRFNASANRFERQRQACASGLAFAFTEGAVVDAIKTGKWVLLDEFNLASSETLQRLCGLLENSLGSVTLTERGDSEAVQRHPDFRLFAAMNPATDAGKRDLPPSIRCRFTEIYVDELLDAVELRTVGARYLEGALPESDGALAQTSTIARCVEAYLQCRDLAEKALVDASGQRPRYTMRTLCRALSAGRHLVRTHDIGLNRSILEGFELAFEGALDVVSGNLMKKQLERSLGMPLNRKDKDVPSRRPGSRTAGDKVLLVKPFWIPAGPNKPVDWSKGCSSGRPTFILTPSVSAHLRRLARAVAAGPWPVLLEGPTSSGKTTIVEYLGARCGHTVVRINNHEHTDVQEYIGAYSSDTNGSLSFRDGILVQALRKGHWVILDELNLAPSEVLEALNRLLDDNRELYLPEVNETVRPHPSFRLFATQNPSGAYGGRKPLSRAFRNRFVELYFGDIPAEEMVTILECRCGCPPSHARDLVEIMKGLRLRRSKTGVFLGKDGLVTPRDLLRWAQREASSKVELAVEGYMLLAERLRSDDEKRIVLEEIQSKLNVVIDLSEMYHGAESTGRAMLSKLFESERLAHGKHSPISTIVPTKSILRLIALVSRCIDQKEPVLLVGDTGCGKTTVVQLLSILLKRKLRIVNCHATTETSDLIGGLRPVRGRSAIQCEMRNKGHELVQRFPELTLSSGRIPPYLSDISIDELPPDCVEVITMLVAKLRVLLKESALPSAKRQKLEEGKTSAGDVHLLSESRQLISDIDDLARTYSSLFEWADGPLISAMRGGDMMLLDEMSLAEDAVLERLNSVLEPSRTIVLAEKNDSTLEADAFNDAKGHTVVGHENFRMFATMNPGGDFGKRELSPALRSRFTEIWVSPVSDPADVALVLDGTFDTLNNIQMKSFRDLILKYVRWFNGDLCEQPSSPRAVMTLSLRDILGWAKFIVEVLQSCDGLSAWEAYCHGACLMHLDGLGLGTGLSLETAAVIRSQACLSLLEDIPKEYKGRCLDILTNQTSSRLVTGDRFGLHPFSITTGPNPLPDNDFSFDAPTTSLNLSRLLRAMQISKPVLLEGSAGVGKSSLISALASASGYNLVRINLSEQTDISDLMGSDLPVPTGQDESQERDRNERDDSLFRWCDGAFLQAIRRGDWVLLDELNLANQSVLEGLNSCLDHRASVFIPELGQTVACPPSFRVFAAQNPIAQGGGRKGLPKSFLNRFTKVYFEALSDIDMLAILTRRFPSIPTALARTMIEFNELIRCSTVENHDVGESGSPWEFNLRDVCRWCELLETRKGPLSDSQVDHGASILYLRRFRSMEDRRQVCLYYERCFGRTLSGSSPPVFSVAEHFVHVGESLLKRQVRHCTLLGCQAAEDSVVYRSSLRTMEALGRCIEMKWPCLLVGSSGTGKSTVLTSMADLCNAHLVTVSLTPASDVTELVGTFEQSDLYQEVLSIRRNLNMMVDTACLYLPCVSEYSMVLHDMVTLTLEARSCPDNQLIGVSQKILPLFQSFMRSSESLHEAATPLVTSVQRSIGVLRMGQNESSHFRWVDGILVTAMSHGHWLHLENVNYCSSSVLDRLNPLMERGGELLLTECSIHDGRSSQSSHRVVKPHPNFRLFLSMDASFGEVSRAMRNRCVEIAFIPSPEMFDGDNFVCEGQSMDGLDSTWQSGLRSSSLCTGSMKLQSLEIRHSRDKSGEPAYPKMLPRWARTVSGLIARGADIRTGLVISTRLVYETTEKRSQRLTESIFNEGTLMKSLHLPAAASPTVRWGWSLNPEMSKVCAESRLVKTVWPKACSQCSPATLFPEGLSEFCCLDQEHKSDSLRGKPAEVCPRIPDGVQGLSAIRIWALILFLIREAPNPLRLSWLTAYPSDAKWYGRLIASLIDPTALRDCAFVKNVSTRRLGTLVRRKSTYDSLRSRNPSELLAADVLSPIEVSYCLQKAMLDGSLVACPVTPLIHPFISAIEEWIARNVLQFGTPYGQLLVAQEDLLSHVDRIWLCLRELRYKSRAVASFLRFDESGFLVQWTWLKKRLETYRQRIAELCQPREVLPTEREDTVAMLTSSIDRILFGPSGDVGPSITIVWKAVRPRLAKNANDWESIESLNRLAAECSLVSGCIDPFLRKKRISLTILLEELHPALYVTNEDKYDILDALAMASAAATDEVWQQQDSRPSYFRIDVAFMEMRKRVDERRNNLIADEKAARIDSQIITADNAIDVDTTERLKIDHADCTFFNRILLRYARLQLCPVAELWCVQEEQSIIEDLCRLEMRSSAVLELHRCLSLMAARVKDFISIALSRSTWSLADLRPYQTLLWACKSTHTFQDNSSSTHELLRCLLPRMVFAASRHMWESTFNDLSAISLDLGMPKPWVVEPSAHTSSKEMNTTLTGPARMLDHVRTEVIFRLYGGEFAGSLSSVGRLTCTTVENHSARAWQIREITKDLASLSERKDTCFSPRTISYFTARIIRALAPFFSKQNGRVFLDMVLETDGLRKITDSYLESLLESCSHPIWKECRHSIVAPLFSILKRLDDRESIATAWIYLGLLEMQFLVPRSPLDPGQKPEIKVREYDRYLSEVQAELAARRMDSGCLNGDFAPVTPEIHSLIREGSWSLEKRNKQAKKIIHRARPIPTFFDLFRESRQFWSSMMSADGVVNLVVAIHKARTSPAETHSARNRMRVWEDTTDSFCRRMVSHFSQYEDVVLPFVNAMYNVRRGVNLLCRVCFDSDDNSLMRSLLVFPFGNIRANIPSSPNFAADNDITDRRNAREIGLGSLALALAKLGRVDLRQHVYSRLHVNDLLECHSLFLGVSSAWLSKVDHQTDDISNTDESELEKSYREQFPDYSMEFENALVQDDKDDDEAGQLQSEADGLTVGDFALSEDQVSLFCSLHKDIFSQPKPGGELHSRARAFRLAYLAAFCISLGSSTGVSRLSSSTQEEEPLGGHLMAISHNPAFAPSTTSLADAEDLVDFYRGANPAELANASDPLRRLAKRTSQLLTAFPGHSILVAIGQVIERVLRLPLDTTPVGKALSGLEVILMKCQEWEEHASDRVKLGPFLKDVSSLVASWRRLELQSWPLLLELRENRYVKRARGLWPRLYTSLHAQARRPLCFDSDKECRFLSSDSPQWVWKGIPGEGRGFSSCESNFSVKMPLRDLTQAVDTFLLTASLGEWSERLEMVRAFACQFAQTASATTQTASYELLVARMLSSIVTLYSQFLPTIKSHIAEARRPIERRLKDEVRLSKWDEQSYYALAESTEKNQRRLMRLLREYDKVLDTSIATVLERLACRGVRTHGEADRDEPALDIPPFASMFSLLNDAVPLKESKNRSTTSPIQKIDIARQECPASIISYGDKFVTKMDHYRRRMCSLLSTDEKSTSLSSDGAEKASFLSSSIFERIEALRKPKTSKQMKQRALVDLFKALKDDGYQTTKWSVPEEIHRMEDVLQLPVPSNLRAVLSTGSESALERGEAYFHKSLSERGRMTSEIALTGSQHLSNREMQVMHSLSDHGFLLTCQQRCIIAKAISVLGCLQGLNDEFAGLGDSLPLYQTAFERSMAPFHDGFWSAVENLNQLSLLMKKTMAIVKDVTSSEKMHHCISGLDACITMVKGCPPPEPSCFATETDVKRVGESVEVLRAASRQVQEMKQDCQTAKWLPDDIYTPCILEIQRTAALGSSVLDRRGFEGNGIRSKPRDVLDGVSSVVQATLLAVQGLTKESQAARHPLSGSVNGRRIIECHKSVAAEFSSMNLAGLERVLCKLASTLRDLHDDDSTPKPERELLVETSSKLALLVRNLLDTAKRKIDELVNFYRETTKLNYICLRVFRVLLAKGLCSVESEDGGKGSGEGSGMNFEDDQEGTGMGEGQGTQDVTDQLESEEQLLGLNDNTVEETTASKPDSNQLGKDEAQQGMEMENDFDGDLFDVPEPDQDDRKSDGEDEEELDREMGDGPDPSEQVIDEKMWDASDDEGDVGQPEEKFEMDSKVNGEVLEDEIRTKNGDGKDEDHADDVAAAGSDELDEDQGENRINDDLADDYEDKHLDVDVRDEQQSEADDAVDAIPIDEDLNLDGTDDLVDDLDGPDFDGDSSDHEEAVDASVDEEGTDSTNEEKEPDLEEETVAASGGQTTDRTENPEDIAPEVENAGSDPEISNPQTDKSFNDTQGIRAKDGSDNIAVDDDEEADDDEDMSFEGEGQDAGNADRTIQASLSGGGVGSEGDTGDRTNTTGETAGEDDKPASDRTPNPFRDPGDATQYWHRKLNLTDSLPESDCVEDSPEDSNDPFHATGEFEYAPAQQSFSTQVLGETDIDDAAHLDPEQKETPEGTSVTEQNEPQDDIGRRVEESRSKARTQKTEKRSVRTDETEKGVQLEKDDEMPDASPHDDRMDIGRYTSDDEDVVSEGSDTERDSSLGNRVVSDLAQLHVDEVAMDPDRVGYGGVVEEELTSGMSAWEAAAARARWSEIQGETQNLSRRLCEKLRLVMEPLVATKLRGDYRTGKRINMKRVIGYIASGYRKDKIWLRRTKPAKRNYRVLLAVDNSESMQKSRTGDMALAALATLATGMSQLEIGELGIASFGEEMRLIHPFHQPFTSESGANVVHSFPFNEMRTRTALCVESVLSVMETKGDFAALQLVFLVSDGRIERDSRTALRRLVREMVERNILLVMIIVEGSDRSNKKDSIIHMKEVSFENGKPKVKQFIEDYPFPYYMVLEDLHSLPEVLGDALRQWFEMIAQLQSSK